MKTVLLVHAHPEPTSLTRQLVELSRTRLREAGYRVLESDLYGMGWKAVFDERDFPARSNHQRLSFIEESGHAYLSGRQAADIAAEQEKLIAADAVILHFPLWWYGMPAIMKGWIDRVWAYGLAYGYKNEGNRYRFGDGAFKGKRAMLSVTVGGPAQDYSPRGICGPVEQLLFPITHGTLYFPGFDVLPTFAAYGTGRIDEQGVRLAQEAWRRRVDGLFADAPIPFRPQNGGDYPDGHVLADHVAPGLTGILAHVVQPSVAFSVDRPAESRQTPAPRPAAPARP